LHTHRTYTLSLHASGVPYGLARWGCVYFKHGRAPTPLALAIGGPHEVLPVRSRWLDGCPPPKPPLCCPILCHVGCPGLFVSIILMCVPSQDYFPRPSLLSFSCYNTHRPVSRLAFHISGHLVSMIGWNDVLISSSSRKIFSGEHLIYSFLKRKSTVSGASKIFSPRNLCRSKLNSELVATHVLVVVYYGYC